MKSALAGYRVLDLTDEKAMLCSRLLAQMGAEVIMVEPPAASNPRESPDFCYLNAGKRSLTLDLAKTPGQDVFKRLVKTTDVVVESAAPGHMATLGLDYARLGKINPRLIMASVTGFGQTGPYRDYKISDLVAEALGGQMYVAGDADTPPLKTFGDQAYYTASLFAANGIMLALWQRHVTGKGQYIDISIMECAAATLDHVLVRYFYEGVVSKRQGSLHWNGAFRVFPCRDGYILLSLFQQWETLAEWLDAEGMAADLTDKRWRDREERLRNIDHIIEVLERWTQSHTVSELVEKGQLMRFPWAEVATIPRLLKSPQLAGRNFWVDLECGGRKLRSAGPACKLSESPWQAGGHVPRKGEANKEIYRELEISAAEIDALSGDEVI